MPITLQHNIDIENIRAQFPILQQQVHNRPLIYFDNAASSQKPLAVIETITNYYKHEHSNVHRGVHYLSSKATDKFEESRKIIARHINASSEHEVIFTKGTTEAINLVATSFGEKFINEGDEIIISEMEHHSNIVPWQLLAQRKNAIIKAVPITSNGSLNIQALKKHISDKTKIIALTHVSNALGTINPVKEIIRLAHQYNIPVLLDGAQAIPHQKVDVQDLDVDFYAFSLHKMYGPTGVGILYGKEKWLEEMPPYQGGGEMIEKVTLQKTTFNTLPFKFEAGTPPIAAIIAIKPTVEFIESVGIENIQQYEHQLLEYATEKLQNIEGFRIYGTAPQKAAVISFLLNDTHPYDIGVLLDNLGIAVRTGHHCAEPLMQRFNIPGTARASFAIYNTLEEIDFFVESIRKIQKILL